MVLAESDASLGAFFQRPEPIDLGLQVLLPLASRFQFLLDDLPVLASGLVPSSSVGDRGDVAVADALLERLWPGGLRAPAKGCPARV